MSNRSPCLWLAAGLLAASAVILAATGLTNDTNSLLQGALRLLSGSGLYSHWIEQNPPLIYDLFLLPAFIVRKAGWSGAAALHVPALALCGLSLILLRRYGLRDMARAQQYSWLLLTGYLFFFAPAYFHVFSDREFLLLVFALPWIVERLRGRPASLPAAAFAAVGFCLKPYNLAIFLALVLFGGPADEKWRGKLLSPATLVIGGSAVVYLLLVVVFMPDYFRQMLPLAFAAYGFLALPLGRRFFTVSLFLWPAVTFLELGPLLAGRRRAYALLLSCAVLYLLNGGWIYTLYPVFAAMLLAGLQQILPENHGSMTDKQSRALWRSRLIFIGGLVLFSVANGMTMAKDVVATRLTGYTAGAADVTPVGDLPTRLKAAAGPSFILLSTSVWSSILSGPEQKPVSVLSYEYLWPLPWLVAHPGGARAEFVRAALDKPVVQAMRAVPEAALIVDESPRQRHMPPGYDLLAFFSRDPDFAAGLSRYRRVALLDACSPASQWECRFSVWRRMAAQ